MKRVLVGVILCAAGACVTAMARDASEGDAGKEHWRPFGLGEGGVLDLPIEARLKFSYDKFGDHLLKATVLTRNKGDNPVWFAVHVAVFDKEKELLAAGSYRANMAHHPGKIDAVPVLLGITEEQASEAKYFQVKTYTWEPGPE